MANSARFSFDTLIIGSGLAGQTTALHLAAAGQRVALISKRKIDDGATSWAQGGIAAVIDPNDSVEAHIQDTFIAGAGLCATDATRYVIEHSREAVEWLLARGVPFTSDSKHPFGYHLTREGGHGQRRIIHAEDATGAAVHKTLATDILKEKNITVFENHIAIDLILGERLGHKQNGCLGAYILDIEKNKVRTFAAANTVLATGGAGKVYLYTTNPDVATGDGIAMAWRAGCRVVNMEFIQFHPTCLYHQDAKSFLISEALRGEGGILRLPDGTRFMPKHDKRAELAPRDVVARAIDFEMKRHGLDCVYLDMTHKQKPFIKKHFPNIYQRCLELGIDMSAMPIPVVPAAHYSCGGIKTDLHARSDINGLYAVGETACTGLHGANRLASNSLLECMVFGKAASEDILTQKRLRPKALPNWDASRVTSAEEEVVIAHNWEELRRMMWNYVGIVRSDKRLQLAKARLKVLSNEIHDYYANHKINNDLIELRNLIDVAGLIIASAMRRKESRGLHFSRDHSKMDKKASNTVLRPKEKRN